MCRESHQGAAMWTDICKYTTLGTSPHALNLNPTSSKSMQVHSIIHIQVAKADLETIPRLSSHYILSLSQPPSLLLGFLTHFLKAFSPLVQEQLPSPSTSHHHRYIWPVLLLRSMRTHRCSCCMSLPTPPLYTHPFYSKLSLPVSNGNGAGTVKGRDQ